MTQEHIDTSLEVTLLESLDFAPRCESANCREERHLSGHNADWVVLISCGHDMLWCNARLARYNKRVRKLAEQGDADRSGMRCSTCFPGTDSPGPDAWVVNTAPVKEAT